MCLPWYDPQRLQSAVAFQGTEYGYEDLIAANVYTLTGVMPQPPVPDPATGTLSLLALGALCAREVGRSAFQGCFFKRPGMPPGRFVHSCGGLHLPTPQKGQPLRGLPFG